MTVSFFVAFGWPFVELEVKVTFAEPGFFAVMFVMDVPGASGWPSGGAMYLVPVTVTAPEPEADQRWPCSVGS